MPSSTSKGRLLYLTIRTTFHSGRFEFRQAVQRTSLFQSAVSRNPRVLVQSSTNMITFLLVTYKEGAGDIFSQFADTRNIWQCVDNFFFIVAPCILTTLMFLSPTNALLYYTYKMLKYTVKISHDCSYMFRSIWTIIREPMPNLAKFTILCRYSVKIRR